MTGSMRGGEECLTGSGSSSPFGAPCGHDETELRAAASRLAKAQTAAEEAQTLLTRAEGIDWTGPAATAFRGSAATIRVRLAALGAALAGLALVVAAAQTETASCTGVAGGGSAPQSGAATPAAAPRGLVVEAPAGPLVPLASRTPALRLPGPTQPAFTRGLADPDAGEACR